jgi:hypothetical protein
MRVRFDELDNITVDVSRTNFLRDNYTTILLQTNGTNIELEISDSAYRQLGEALFPNGLMPDTFRKKVELLKFMMDEVGGVYDIENKSFYISKVFYEVGDDKVYFDCKEEQE